MAVKLTGLVFLLFVSMLACSQPDDHSDDKPASVIAAAVSLQQDAQRAGGRPIIVFVSQRGCEYCQLLRERVLHPLIRSGELDERAELRELRLDADFSLRDFQGQQISGFAFATRYGVNVTPTLLFLDANGASLADPIIGTNNIEYYEVYLNRAIDAASKLQNRQL